MAQLSWSVVLVLPFLFNFSCLLLLGLHFTSSFCFPAFSVAPWFHHLRLLVSPALNSSRATTVFLCFLVSLCLCSFIELRYTLSSSWPLIPSHFCFLFTLTLPVFFCLVFFGKAFKKLKSFLFSLYGVPSAFHKCPSPHMTIMLQYSLIHIYWIYKDEITWYWLWSRHFERSFSFPGSHFGVTSSHDSSFFALAEISPSLLPAIKLPAGSLRSGGALAHQHYRRNSSWNARQIPHLHAANNHYSQTLRVPDDLHYTPQSHVSFGSGLMIFFLPRSLHFAISITNHQDNSCMRWIWGMLSGLCQWWSTLAFLEARNEKKITFTAIFSYVSRFENAPGGERLMGKFNEEAGPGWCPVH